MDRFIDEVVATADHVGARLRQPASDQALLRRVERLVPVPRSRPTDGRGWAEAPRAASRTTTPSPTPSSSGACSSRCSATPTGSASPARRSWSTSSPRSATRTGGPAWRQTIFHPFALTARYARGTVLRTEPVSPRYETTGTATCRCSTPSRCTTRRPASCRVRGQPGRPRTSRWTSTCGPARAAPGAAPQPRRRGRPGRGQHRGRARPGDAPGTAHHHRRRSLLRTPAGGLLDVLRFAPQP